MTTTAGPGNIQTKIVLIFLLQYTDTALLNTLGVRCISTEHTRLGCISTEHTRCRMYINSKHKVYDVFQPNTLVVENVYQLNTGCISTEHTRLGCISTKHTRRRLYISSTQ